MPDERYIQGRRIELLVTGERKGLDANSTLHAGYTQNDLDRMVANWTAMEGFDIPVELGDHEAPMLAGMLNDLRVEPSTLIEGEFVLTAQPYWTKRASELINSGELPGVSIEEWTDWTDKKTGKKLSGPTIRAVALVSRPFYDSRDVTPVMLSDARKNVTVTVGPLGTTNDDEPTGEQMKLSEVFSNLEAEELAAMLEPLGLTPDSDVDALAAAMRESVSMATELADSNKKLEEATAQLADASEKVKQLSDASPKAAVLETQVKMLSDQVATLEAEQSKLLEEKRVKMLSEFIERGQSAGKISTAKDAEGVNSDVENWTKLYTSDPELATKMLSDAPTRSVAVGGSTGVTPTGDSVDTDVHVAARRAQNEAAKSGRPISYDQAMKIAKQGGQAND